MDTTPTTGLDPRFARELGRQLKALRERRRETEEDVGKRLLMSPNQVRALEQGDGEPFYGPRYHVQAARKYATLSGLDFDALESEVASGSGAADPTDEPPAGMPFVAGEARTVGRAAAARPSMAQGRRKLAIGAASAVAVAVVAVVGVRLMPGPKPAPHGTVTSPVAVPQPGEGTPANGPAPLAAPQAAETADAAPTPPAPSAPSSGAPATPAAPAMASSSTAPAGAPKTEPDALADAGTSTASQTPRAAAHSPAATDRTGSAKAHAAHTGELRIAFSGPTTLQIVRRDGTRQTRTVRAKQTVALKRKDLQAIVIGDWKKAALTSEGKRIDLARFRKAGSSEARLVGTKLRTLGE